jgi:hypothetical protein
LFVIYYIYIYIYILEEWVSQSILNRYKLISSLSQIACLFYFMYGHL